MIDTNHIMIDKKEIRRVYKEKRTSLSNHEIKEKSLAIAHKALDLFSDQHKIFHIFCTIEKQKEIQTKPLITLLLQKSKTVCAPKTVQGSHELKHYQISEKTQFATNGLGIPEPIDGIEISPTDIDVVFVPLFAFDKKGNRVGYGGGFYDRFLSKCRKGVVKVGLSLFLPLEEELNSEPHDVPLNLCITPSKVYTPSSMKPEF